MESNDDLLEYSHKFLLPTWEDRQNATLAEREVDNLISYTFDGLEYKLVLYGSAMTGLNLKGEAEGDLDFSLSFPTSIVEANTMNKRIRNVLIGAKVPYKTHAASFSGVKIIRASFG